MSYLGNSYYTHLIICTYCDPPYEVSRTVNPNWVFPCDITYHCSKCDNKDVVHYPKDCILADKVKLTRDKLGSPTP